VIIAAPGVAAVWMMRATVRRLVAAAD